MRLCLWNAKRSVAKNSKRKARKPAKAVLSASSYRFKSKLTRHKKCPEQFIASGIFFYFKGKPANNYH